MGLQTIYSPEEEAAKCNDATRILNELEELDNVVSRQIEQLIIDNNLIVTNQTMIDAITRKEELRVALLTVKDKDIGTIELIESEV